VGELVQATVGWSKRGFIPQLAGYNDRPTAINPSTARRRYTRKQPIRRHLFVQLRHLSQEHAPAAHIGLLQHACCGLAFEYQTVNFGSNSSVPSDHRFFMSFTLAGLGNFSPFNGALGGVPR